MTFQPRTPALEQNEASFSILSKTIATDTIFLVSISILSKEVRCVAVFAFSGCAHGSHEENMNRSLASSQTFWIVTRQETEEEKLYAAYLKSRLSQLARVLMVSLQRLSPDARLTNER